MKRAALLSSSLRMTKLFKSPMFDQPGLSLRSNDVADLRILPLIPRQTAILVPRGLEGRTSCDGTGHERPGVQPRHAGNTLVFLVANVDKRRVESTPVIVDDDGFD